MLLLLFSLIWSQSTWTGGGGQISYTDTTKFYEEENIDIYKPRGTLSLKYSGFSLLWDLKESAADSVSRITQIERVGSDSIFILKSFPGKVYISVDLGDPQIFAPLSSFSVLSYNDFFRFQNWWYLGGKTSTSYILLISQNNGQKFYQRIISPAPKEINKIFFYKNFFNLCADATASQLYYSLNPDFSSISYLYVVWAANLKDLIFSYFNNGMDTVAIGIIKTSGESVFYTKTPYIRTSWVNFFGTFKNVLIGHPLFDTLSGILFVPYTSTTQSFIWRFNFPANSLALIDSIYIDNSNLFNALTMGKDENIYGATSQGVYRTADRIKWDTLGSVPNAFSIFQTDNYELLGGTLGGAQIYKANYPSYGYLVSSIFDSRGKDEGATFFKKVYIRGTDLWYIKIQIRGDTLPDMSTALSWEFIPYSSNGSPITHLDPKMRYFQYRIIISRTSVGKTPFVDRVYFTYDLDTTGPLISECFISDGEFSQNGIDSDDRLVIVFNENTNKPFIDVNGIDTLFYVSGGNTLAGADSAKWISDDTLVIFLYNSLSPPVPEDTLKIIKKFIKDIYGNSTLSQSIITGSYDDIIPPKLKKVYLSDGSFFDNGANIGDTVYMIFSEKTDTPFIYPESLDVWFPLQNGSWLNSGYTLQTEWKSQDTLLVLFNGSGEEPIKRGDTVYVSPANPIEDLWRNKIAEGKVRSEGSLDYEKPYIESAIFYDYPPLSPSPNSSFDHVIIKFSEPVVLLKEINETNIDSALVLSSSHSWLSGSGEITRTELINDTIFLIQFSTEGGNPSVTEGDTIYPDTLFFADKNLNKIISFKILQRVLDVKEFVFNDKKLKIKFEPRSIKVKTPFDIKLLIYDITGRNVLKRIIKKGYKKIDLSLKNGIYFIKIDDGNKNILKRKFMVIK